MNKKMNMNIYEQKSRFSTLRPAIRRGRPTLRVRKKFFLTQKGILEGKLFVYTLKINKLPTSYYHYY